ncbi:MAG: hypothetical protein GTO24_23105 [candidate division Zixibacteria bacterium]|nr:hypothetical protein [candidate division Zixibacteria bacterium]
MSRSLINRIRRLEEEGEKGKGTVHLVWMNDGETPGEAERRYRSENHHARDEDIFYLLCWGGDRSE